MADTRTPDQKAKDIEKTLDCLIKIRKPYEPMIDEVLRYVNHGRRLITDTAFSRGQKTGIDVYDGTAISALNLLTDGICGYSVSKSYRWFSYTLPGKTNFPRWSIMRRWSGKRMDEYPQVKEWLADVEEVMYAAYLRSNFYDVISEMVRDAASVGTVTPIAEEDVGSGRIVFTVPHFREIYIAEDRFGSVNTRYRVYSLSLRQMADKFGLEKMMEVDQNFKDKYEKNPFEEMEIIHAVYPRSDFNPEAYNAENKPVASMWVLRSPLKLLLESGYDERPIMSWRWRKNSDEIYGRSPSWDAYVDIMKANQQGKDNLIAAHKIVDQPIIAPEDLRGKINKGAGGMTFMDRSLMKDMGPRQLYASGINLPYAVDQQERTDKILNDHFYVGFFLMLWQAAMNKVELTATQVVEMAGEKAAILGVRIGRQESELLNPVHDRSFSIENKAGRIPEPPQILAEYGGRSIEIDYLGPLAQAQKKIYKSQSIRSGLQAVSEVSQTYPDAALVIDHMGALRDLLDAQGFPVNRFRSEEEIKQILALKQREEEAQRTLQEGIEVAKVLPKGSKKAEAGSPLDMLVNPEGEGR